MYFVPMFDDTDGYYDAASGVKFSKPSIRSALKLTTIQWWSYWGALVDGLFSWEAAWPAVGDGSSADWGSMSPDTPVIDAALANSKSYMVGE